MNLRQFTSETDHIDAPLPIVVVIGLDAAATNTSPLVRDLVADGRAVVLVAMPPAVPEPSVTVDDESEYGAQWERLVIEDLHTIDERGVVANYRLHPLDTEDEDPDATLARGVAEAFGERTIIVVCGERAPVRLSAFESALQDTVVLLPVADPDAARSVRRASQQVRRHVESVLGLGPDQLHKDIDGLLEAFVEAASRHSTLDLRHYKRGTFVRRIAQRIQFVGASNAADYLARLHVSPSEILTLLQSVFIGATSFFRDTDAFLALESHLETRIIEDAAAGVSDPLRVWVPGCSTGEEAYSIAMVVNDLLQRLQPSRTFQVFATDLNTAALVTARRGEFSSDIASSISPERLSAYFEPHGDRLRANEALRERILFSVHNLINDPSLNRLDVISCRNLMIYLGPHLQKKLFPLFHVALAPRGTLFLGSSESFAAHEKLFALIDLQSSIATRRCVPTRSVPGSVTPHARRLPVSEEPASVNLMDLMRGIVMDEFAPASVVIDSEGRIRTASANMDRFLIVAADEFKNNILWLARPGLRSALKAAIRDAEGTKRRGVADRVWMHSDAGDQQVTMTVQPMPTGGQATGLFIAVFHAVGLPISPSRSLEASSEARTRQLEATLQGLRRESEHSVQSLEATNEELRATNEELNASKEEVQRGLLLLENAHTELESLLISTEVATIFIDLDGLILRFTPSAGQVFNLIQSDIGCPLEHLTHRAEAMPPLEDQDGTGAPIRTSLLDGTVMQRRVRPLLAADGRMVGRVISFDDITEVDASRRELNRHHAELSAVYESAGVGLALVTNGFTIKRANQQFQSLTTKPEDRDKDADSASSPGSGSSADRTLQATLPLDLFEGIEHLLDDVAAGRHRMIQIETKGHDHHGDWTCWRASARCPDNAIQGSDFTLSIEDITQRVEAENEAIKSRVYLQSIFDAIQAFIGVCDGEGRLTECNRRSLEVVGAQLQDIIGVPFEDCPWWSHDGEVRRLVRSGMLEALGGASVRRSLTYCVADGRVRHLDFQAHPLFDTAGEIHSVVVSGFDTEERFLIAERMRITNRRLEIALRSVGMGTWWWFTATDALIWDEAQKLLWGFPIDESVTLDMAIEMIHPDDRELFVQVMDIAVANQTTYEHDFRIIFPDGSTRRLAAQGEVFFDEETNRQVLVGVNWDITGEFDRARELEEAWRQAEAANHAKGEFLANMSHEIRTPMTAILGYSDILAKHIKDPDDAVLVDTIRRNGRFLLEILNDILDLAKIESGMQSVQLEISPPEQVVEDVASLMQVRALEKGIELKTEYGSQMPLAIESDSKRLRQVLLNLVGNAIKFTDQGGVTLLATTREDNVVFEVSDTGIGIAEEDLSALFEPFTQVDNSVQRQRGGTGLGLTISRRLCRAMGGDLTVTSHLGAGSRFQVTLPLGSQEPVARTIAAVYPGAQPTAGEVPCTTLEGRLVLVVDDRRDVRTLVQFMIEDAGASTVLASHGAEAIGAYETSLGPGGRRLDLIVMDMQMPIMDGYAAATRLRGMGCDLPIVAVTAHAMQGELERCLAAGCTAYTTKPIDGDVLLSLAVKHLQGR